MDGWDDTPEWDIPDNYVPKTKVSVVIAARNEEKHIGECIDSILRNKYPGHLFEIIIVDDHSEDNTQAVVHSYPQSNIKLIRLEDGNGKKSALVLGIKHATGTLIACTDADCVTPEKWLLSLASFQESTDANCIAGPIAYQVNKTLIQRFQYLDALNNMCVTANGIRKNTYHLANGANLIFTKDVFEHIGGYPEKEKHASGDDVFLIQKIAEENPTKVRFLKSKDTIVLTKPELNLKDLKQQRIRWATKSKSYKNPNIIRIQGFVFAFVLILFVNLFLSPLGSGLSFFGFLLALFIKWTMDYLYLSKMADFFGERDPLKSFFGASLGFIYYILFTGFKALFPTKYNWKGRDTR